MSSKFLIFVLALLALSRLSDTQNCDGDTGSFVGFTALTPDQLKKAIEDSVQSSVFDTLSPAIESLLSLNDTMKELVERVSRMEQAVESTVTSAVVNSLVVGLERSFQLALNEAVVNLSRVIEQTRILLPPTFTSSPPSTAIPPSPIVPPQFSCQLGVSPSLPGSSCKQIYSVNSFSPSGFYWVGGGAEPPRQVYCDMERSCGGVVGGWTRIANVDMTNDAHSCPSNMLEESFDEKLPRLCTLANNFIGCSSTLFPAYGIGYDRVCGRIIGYQDRTPNAFFPYHVNRSLTVDDTYLDGVSLTHGFRPRQHIWSFAAALDESDGHQSGCPCLNVESETQPSVPPFVGNDYFCDTGSADDVKNIFYPENPLWDGEGCGQLNECCDFNKPPWFSKALSRSVADDIEMRICRDAGGLNEDIPLELVEIYVR